MKTLKTIIAVFGLAIMFNACGPNVDEEVEPSIKNKDLKQFDVKSNESGDDVGRSLETD